MKRILNFGELKRPAAASLWYIAASAVTKAVGVLSTPIFTRAMSEGEYGLFSLYMSWLGVGSVICSAISQGSVIYKGFEKYGNEKSDFLCSAYRVSFGFCALICILLFTFLPFSGIGYGLCATMSAQLLCDTAIAVGVAKRRYEYSYIKVVSIALAQAVAAPVLGIILIRGAGLGAMGRIMGLLGISLIIALPLTARAFSRWHYKKEADLYIIKRALPLLPHSVGAAVSAQADKLIITAYLGTAALAKYSVAHSLGAGLTMTVTALSAALNPWILRKLAKGQTKTVAEVTDCGMLMLSAAVMLLVGGAPEAMLILAPAEYSEALPAVAPIAMSTIPAFAASVCTVGLVSREQGGKASLSAMAALAVSCLANLLFVPRLGFLGAGAALLLSQTVSALLGVYSLTKMGIAEILPLKSLLFAMAFTAIWTPLLTANTERLYVRLLLLVPAILIFLTAALKIKNLVIEKRPAV